MKTLFLIPARGGSKGIPDKNIRSMAGRPLIYYTLDVARSLSEIGEIFVSTDSATIKKVVEAYGLEVPILRPNELATDTASSEAVISHVLDFYKSKGKRFDQLVLLQPTSPLRKATHLKEALALFDGSVDMVVSVTSSKSNPYFNLFEENKDGFLQKSKPHSFVNRQEVPQVYRYNGAIYVINVSAFEKKGLSNFTLVKKYEMDEEFSIDIDTKFDWEICEYLIERNEKHG